MRPTPDRTNQQTTTITTRTTSTTTWLPSTDFPKMTNTSNARAANKQPEDQKETPDITTNKET